MRKKFTKTFLAGMLAAFISGAVIVPTAVYAAGQTAGQNSQADAPQAEQNTHAGHHPTN